MQVFISHSHKDRKLAKELSSQLSAAGIKVWLTDESVLPAQNLPLEIGKALERSDAMVVLLSPDSVESRDVRSEVSYALSSPRFEGRVIPVVVKPTAGIPWFLRTLPMVRARGARGENVSQLVERITHLLLGWRKEDCVADPMHGGPKNYR